MEPSMEAGLEPAGGLKTVIGPGFFEPHGMLVFGQNRAREG